MLRLVQEFGAHAGRSLEFHSARVRIGRAPDNDVVFDALRTETAVTFAARHRAVFVMKVLGGSD
jgi:hypothetical protein